MKMKMKINFPKFFYVLFIVFVGTLLYFIINSLLLIWWLCLAYLEMEGVETQAFQNILINFSHFIKIMSIYVIIYLFIKWIKKKQKGSK